MGRVSGKVAFVTGAARGQGRSHALRLAEEGADIIAVDILGPVASVSAYPMASAEDMAETVRQVEALDRRIIPAKVDVRDSQAMRNLLDDAVDTLGRLDIVSANAGIFQMVAPLELDDASWQETIDINLTGVWNTARAALPHLIAGGRGGSIVITSSVGGMIGLPNAMHYSAAKHGAVGVMRSLAAGYAQHSIRVNSVHPAGVNTVMIQNEEMWAHWNPENPSISACGDARLERRSARAMPVPWVEPIDVSNVVLFLASDEARYITGIEIAVDAGQLLA
jgi:SDR family mycofactocin-dependent oxidoreductase